jgi:hypothetical protein
MIIEMYKSDSKQLTNLASILPENVKLIESKKFDGVDILSAILIITTYSIKQIKDILIEHIRAKKHVKVIVNGMEYSGIDEDKLIELLNDSING